MHYTVYWRLANAAQHVTAHAYCCISVTYGRTHTALAVMCPSVKEPTGKQARDSTAGLCELTKKKNGKKRSTKEQKKKASSSTARLRTTTNISIY